MFFSGQATLLLNKLENALRDEAKPAAWKTSLRKQPAFRDATTTITHHYPDLSNASDWLKQISDAARPIRSSIQIWVVTRHQYGISAVVSQTSFLGETSGGVAKCRLFSKVTRKTGRETISDGTNPHKKRYFTLRGHVCLSSQSRHLHLHLHFPLPSFWVLFLLYFSSLLYLPGMSREWRNSKNALLICFPNFCFIVEFLILMVYFVFWAFQSYGWAIYNWPSKPDQEPVQRC